MKFLKSYFVIVLFLVILIILAVSGIGWWGINSRPATSEPQTKTVVVKKGASAIQVGNILLEEGIIKSSLAFKIYVQLKGLSGGIQAGEYTLDPSMNLISIVNDLSDGPDAIWVTIPEGTRNEEIAIIFTERFGLAGASAQEYYNEFIASAQNYPGMLFPDTYLFEKQTPASSVVSVLVNTYESKIKGLNVAGDDLIMASLIEREAITDGEKPTIAGVLQNRLTNDWPLQVDATLQFVVANQRCGSDPLGCKWWMPPTIADKDISSKFNTYKSIGLPPEPISNPGIEAIKAAVSPESNDYFFYIHDSDGNVHFAETLEEHNANVNRYIR